jgi:hypothetical protein
MEEFQELLADNPEFKDAIVNDIMKKIKQTDVEEPVVVEEEVYVAPSPEPAMITLTSQSTTTSYEELKQKMLENNNLL